MINAIPTRYGFHTFRSRLEAKWAVFFDQMKLSWEYEDQGYVTDDNETYLPDFRLIDLKLFAEVKPKPARLIDVPKLKRQIVAGSPLNDVEISYASLDIYLHHRPYRQDGRFYEELSPRKTLWYGHNFSEEYNNAVWQAVSAHFEHGDAPQPPPEKQELLDA